MVFSDSLVDEFECTLLTTSCFAAEIERAGGVQWLSSPATLAKRTTITATVAGAASQPNDILVLATAVLTAVDYLKGA